MSGWIENPRGYNEGGAGECYSQTLYQKGARGETRMWRIWVTGRAEEGGEAVIHREHGVLGGKMTGTRRVIRKGKNLGKANETTPLEQAVAEAKSVAAKKAREGYSPEQATRGELEADVVLPMLAHDYHKQKKGLVFPCYAQPKIDGVRMVTARLEDGSLCMTTRTGKTVHFMDHLRHSLDAVLGSSIVLDGELFTPDKTFEEITSIVRKSVRDHHDPEAAKTVAYYVFDAFDKRKPTMPYTERMKLVKDILGFDGCLPGVVIVPTYEVQNQEEANALHERFVGEGYEGTIYRTPSAPYKIRLRSRDLLKRKDFQTDEYRIVGATEGDGKDVGTVIWVVETRDTNERFNVRPRGTREQRAEWWEHREEFIHKMLTVRFQNLTEGGIPRFPVGLTIRDYE